MNWFDDDDFDFESEPTPSRSTRSYVYLSLGHFCTLAAAVNLVLVPYFLGNELHAQAGLNLLGLAGSLFGASEWFKRAEATR